MTFAPLCIRYKIQLWQNITFHFSSTIIPVTKINAANAIFSRNYMSNLDIICCFKASILGGGRGGLGEEHFHSLLLCHVNKDVKTLKHNCMGVTETNNKNILQHLTIRNCNKKSWQ